MVREASEAAGRRLARPIANLKKKPQMIQCRLILASIKPSLPLTAGRN
ncbi:MAG: hypothetical protein L3J82_02700 [Planctomycetes bacterium]|nr:hypothetical protein [Planctomycetota bacterium]